MTWREIIIIIVVLATSIVSWLQGYKEGKEANDGR